MQENYLAKWLNGELTEAELAEFEKTAEYRSYRHIVETVDQLEAPDFDAEKALASLRERRGKEDSKTIPLFRPKSLLRVAAAIAVLLTGVWFYTNSLEDTVTTQFAESKELVLPDMSEIILNADSEIAYNEKKWDRNRNVSLQGEAFFKVAKGKRFTVTTNAGTVTVLGTQFNVEHRGDFFEVSCYEGIVSVGFDSKEIRLTAGRSVVVINGGMTEGNVPANGRPSWINKESSFKSIPLSYVLAEFERQHNIKVETRNIDLNQLYTGTFSNTDINLALRSIATPSRIKFNLEGDKVLFYAQSAP